MRRFAPIALVVGIMAYQTPAPAQQKPQDAREWIASGRLQPLASFEDGSAAYAITPPPPSAGDTPRSGPD